ncbi:MAG: 30S ribosomal protein S4 [Candidatus Yanofskybacteria bacterium]|nr:30S ribosomal protein S4 [Candidatus Yanofskybacteria bacterium]
MARYLGPREKIERRIGEKLGLKGERSHTPKSATVRKPYPPGMHGRNFKGKSSEFGTQLRSKQKVRNIYRLMEKQFKQTVQKALETKTEPYNAIVQGLESRLDNVVFRMGLAQSRDQSRQLVNHGHILVNGKRISIPSYKVKLSDAISVREGSKSSPYFSTSVTNWMKNYNAPDWLEVDKEKPSATIKRYPGIEDSGLRADDLQLLIEYYSR